MEWGTDFVKYHQKKCTPPESPTLMRCQEAKRNLLGGLGKNSLSPNSTVCQVQYYLQDKIKKKISETLGKQYFSNFPYR